MPSLQDKIPFALHELMGGGTSKLAIEQKQKTCGRICGWFPSLTAEGPDNKFGQPSLSLT